MAVTVKVGMAKLWIMGAAEMITPTLALAG
jgi:hypothetical protein